MEDREKLIIGCLLHDIGKIVQRADKNPKSKTHQEFGHDWLEEVLKGKKELGLIPTIALTHHAVKGIKKDELSIFSQQNLSNFTLIAYEADNLSAKERYEYDEDKEDYDWDINTPLYSVFSKIKMLDENEGEEVKDTETPIYNNCFKAYKAKILSNELNFPEENIENSRECYEDILKYFSQKFREIKNNLHVNNLLLLLEKCFSFVPSLTQIIFDNDGNPLKEKFPDISLFDHLKGSAAIANAIYNYLIENNNFNKDFLSNKLLKDVILDINDDKYLLVGCDLSGVQNFIYTISSYEALKSLRARSFYLELISEHIADEILNQLNLFRTNIIYIGGGGFYILAQNTDSAREKILNIKREINNWLFDEFEGKLYANIEFISFKGKDFYLDKEKNCYGLQNVWFELSNKIENSKYRKFFINLNNIIKIKEPIELTETCNICHTDNQTLINIDELKYCSTCKTLTLLGERIKNKNLKYIAKSDSEFIVEDDDLSSVRFKIFNKNYILCNESVLKKSEKEKYYIINDLDPKNYVDGISIPLFVGNYYYKEAKDFESLAKRSEGIERIGVLRMDVDNLGKIFSHGIHKSDASFSRMTSISRNLSLFFKFYINEILSGNLGTLEQTTIRNNNQKTERKAVIIYSGGDDLFIVGSWDDIAELSFDINNCFRKFVSENIDVTISAGFTIHDYNFPLYQMAKLSKMAEKTAKDNEYITNGKKFKKNSISFLYDNALEIKNKLYKEIKNKKKNQNKLSNTEDIIGISLNWDNFKYLLDETKVLYKIYDKLTRADIMKLNRLIKDWQINGKLYLPLLHYVIKKISKKLDEDEDSYNELTNILLKYFINPELIKSLHIPLYWVEFLKRK